jgi:cell division protein FtsQ
MRWKKVVIIVLDIALAVYFGLAVTSFNRPDETTKVCTKVAINIADETTNGFLSAAEIKKILERNQIYPLDKHMKMINPRTIEDVLKRSPFVNTAQCYATQDGHVCINITQRLPIVRIKSNNGDDYYLDDQGGIMPNSRYTSDLIIATGHISKRFAQTRLASLSKTLMSNDFWRNLVEQINVLPDYGIELVPRIGDNIIYLGCLPDSKQKEELNKLIAEFVTNKMDRLEKFYQYGLSEAGWNKYAYINLEFDNQIICKRKNEQAN